MANGKTEPPLHELFADLSRETSTLIRHELTLARLELAQKTAMVGRGLSLVAAGGAVAFAGLLILLASPILLLIELGMSAWSAALFLGGVVSIAGALVTRCAVGALRSAELRPLETTRAMQESVAWLKHPDAGRKHPMR